MQIPSYAFPVYYVDGGHIWPHKDVSDNELSLTMQLQITPEQGNGAEQEVFHAHAQEHVPRAKHRYE